MIAVFRLVGFLPFGYRSRLGFLIGYVAGMVPTRERTIAAKQVEIFLGKTDARIVRRSFANAGSYILETANLDPMLSPPFPGIECREWEKYTALLTGGEPVVVLSAHTGNWDLLAGWCIAHGAKITTIGREARNPAIQAALAWIRDGYGIETIWRSDRSGVKRLITRFREKRVVAALIDQDTRVDSMFVPFFGAPARTPSSLVTLGRKFGARFITAFIVRHGPERFEIHFDELPNGASDAEILAEYNRKLQSLIERYPDQWVWFHKRWRSSPEGKTLSSSEYISWLSERAHSSSV